MRIEWNKVTWYSKLLALALFITLPFTGFYLGIKYEESREAARSFRIQTEPTSKISPLAI